MLQKVSDFGVKVLLLSFVLSLLPMSPFQGLSSLMADIPFLAFANYFFPLTEMLAILETWLVVVAAYYGILYIVNYVGIVKS